MTLADVQAVLIHVRMPDEPDGDVVEVVATGLFVQRRWVHNLTIDGLHTYHVLAAGVAVWFTTAAAVRAESNKALKEAVKRLYGW